MGVGVALSFPVLSAASVAGLPQERFGIGGAMNQTARQIGAVVGVAILIAVVGNPTSLDEALSHFRTAWVIGAIAALGISGGVVVPPTTSDSRGADRRVGGCRRGLRRPLSTPD